jgi:hypothetical protein
MWTVIEIGAGEPGLIPNNSGAGEQFLAPLASSTTGGCMFNSNFYRAKAAEDRNRARASHNVDEIGEFRRLERPCNEGLTIS